MTAFEWIVAVLALFGLFAFLVTVAGIIAGLCSGKQPRQRIIVTLSEKLIPECRFCGSPATCHGKYSEDDAEGYACDECCGHGCEDGHCEILPDETIGSDEMTDAELTRDGWQSAIEHMPDAGVTVYGESR